MRRTTRIDFHNAATVGGIVAWVGALSYSNVAFAQSNATGDLITRFGTYIINPILLVMFAGGFFMFMYGLLQFMLSINSGEDTSTGKRHMIYGTIGMFIMVSVYPIPALIPAM
jgi:uncharacterized membrane protein